MSARYTFFSGKGGVGKTTMACFAMEIDGDKGTDEYKPPLCPRWFAWRKSR